MVPKASDAGTPARSPCLPRPPDKCAKLRHNQTRPRVSSRHPRRHHLPCPSDPKAGTTIFPGPGIWSTAGRNNVGITQEQDIKPGTPGKTSPLGSTDRPTVRQNRSHAWNVVRQSVSVKSARADHARTAQHVGCAHPGVIALAIPLGTRFALVVSGGQDCTEDDEIIWPVAS